MARRSKDPLTAATSSILLPAVKPLGFRKLGSRHFGRVLDGVMQQFGFQLSIYGGRDFRVSFAAMSLSSPRGYCALLAGDRLPRGKSCDGWWPSRTHEAADASMHDVVARFTSHCIPWFERTRTTSGLLAVLRERHTQIGRPHAHFLFEIGCCHAQLGQLSEAEEALLKSIAAYREWDSEIMPAPTWCLDGVKDCECLLAAIHDRRHEQLLAEWRAASVRSMKIEKLFRSGD